MYGINYINTFVPTIRQELQKIFLAIILVIKMILIQMDMIGTFLKSAHSQNEQPIYIKLSQKCFVNQEELLRKILKSLYKLKQKRKFWNKIITKCFQKIGFFSTNTDACILIIKWEREFIILGIYINDLILRSRSQEVLEQLKDQFIKKLSIKDLGEAKTII